MSCARCHDHKFDPIPQQDYYSLAGIFTELQYRQCRRWGTRKTIKRIEETQAKIKKLDADVKGLLQTEKSQRAEAKVSDLAQYLVVAWKYQAAKQKNAKTTLPAVAKADKLDPAVLGRCVKLVEKAGTGFAMMRKMAASEKEVRRRRRDDAKASQNAARPNAASSTK